MSEIFYISDYIATIDDGVNTLYINIVNIKTNESYDTEIDNLSPIFEEHKIINNNNTLHKILFDYSHNNNDKSISISIHKCENANDMKLGRIYISISIDLKYINDSIIIYLRE